MEVARLRALQEKVLDTRSQEDELRAKRYQVGLCTCAGISTALKKPACKLVHVCRMLRSAHSFKLSCA
jgi:hypothetical protein